MHQIERTRFEAKVQRDRSVRVNDHTLQVPGEQRAQLERQHH